MRFMQMDFDDRVRHYTNEVLNEYDGKVLKDWEIARYIPDRELWWTRKNVERYLTDHVMRIEPLPELAKGRYGNDDEMMTMTAPPVDRATDFDSDDSTADARRDPSLLPSPVKVQDIIDLRQGKVDEAIERVRRDLAAKEKQNQPGRIRVYCNWVTMTYVS